MLKSEVYAIRANLVSRLQDEFAKIAKKANKLGTAMPLLLVLGYFLKNMGKDNHGDDVMVNMARVQVSGETPKIAGWAFVAVLQHFQGENGTFQNIIRALPNVELPKNFRHNADYCEHCKQNRYRVNTYVLQNEITKEYKQVGSSCLVDFLGHDNPHNVAKWLESLLSIVSLCESYENEETSNGNYGHGDARMYKLSRVLELTTGVINVSGWLSKTKAYEENKRSTADNVFSLFLPDVTANDRKFRADVESKIDSTLAENAMTWASELTDDETDSNYLHTIRTLASMTHIDAKNFGFACSIIAAYEKAQAKLEAQKDKPISQFIGKEKDKIKNLTATYKTSFSFAGQYGVTFFHIFETLDGNVIKWSTGNALFDIEKGDKVSISGSIKKLENYKGVNQTCLTRCNVEKIMTA